MGEEPRKKVVILGGGMAALTTAFELTSPEDWKETFSEVSIYQVGWRLGGKAASGRNRQIASRIEGTGPHVWFGFYDNAFRLMRDCYSELHQVSQQLLPGWQNVLQPQDTITVYGEWEGRPQPWTLEAPRNDRVPGDTPPRPSPWQLLARCTQLVQQWWTKLSVEPSRGLPEDKAHLKEWADEWVRYAVEFTGQLHEAIRTSGRTKPLMMTALDILNEVHRSVREYVESLIGVDEREQRLWIQQDLALTAMRGALSDWVPIDGFGALDHQDFRAWLQQHGASPRTLSSPLLAGLYGFLFAFGKGDRARPDLAAGVALRLLCRGTLDYQGAAVWTSAMGTGDAVFAPLYDVLRRRGVQFHFFHRVEKLRLSADGSHIEEIHLAQQATPTDDYDPLIDVRGFRCWPDTPRYESLKEGDDLQKPGIDLESPWSDWDPVEHRQLQVGTDFDTVVLGISLGALPYCCSELIAASPEWERMFARTLTVPTAASQLWFDRTLRELGWNSKPPSMLAASRPPLETWIEFTDSRSLEEWGAAVPGSTAALRGALRELEDPPPPGPSDYPEQQRQRVHAAALDWLKMHGAKLWPELHDADGNVRWEFLFDSRDRQGEERFEDQYEGAMISPSDRYVQSVAGSIRFRLPADRAWFGNLFVCGDWTRTRLNVGCLEAAVMSGRDAAAAVRGEQVEPTGDW